MPIMGPTFFSAQIHQESSLVRFSSECSTQLPSHLTTHYKL